MFDTITIKESRDFYFDLGRLAESLLFYKKVIFLCSPSFFESLAFASCKEHFLDLMYSKQIEVKIEDNIFGIRYGSSPIDLSKGFKLVLVKGKNISAQDRVERAILKATGRKGFSRRFSRRVIENSEVIFHPQEIIKYASEDLEDEMFLKRAISSILKLDYPSLEVPSEIIHTDLKKINNGYTLVTNIDYEKLGLEDNYFKHFSDDTVLFNIVHSRLQSTFASTNKSDLSTTESIAVLIEKKVSELIKKSVKNQSSISSFSKMRLEGKMIKNVIHEKEQKFEDFVQVLEKANKFKEWLNSIESEDILYEYQKKVTEKTFVDKLLCKPVRWSIFTGLGILIESQAASGVGAVSAGVALSASEAFLLDKIIKGWKPNSFIDNDLKRFIKN